MAVALSQPYLRQKSANMGGARSGNVQRRGSGGPDIEIDTGTKRRRNGHRDEIAAHRSGIPTGVQLTYASDEPRPNMRVGQHRVECGTILPLHLGKQAESIHDRSTGSRSGGQSVNDHAQQQVLAVAMGGFKNGQTVRSGRGHADRAESLPR
jgi:hypothetical protein